MPAFGEWQPESTAPTNAAVLIYVEDWEHYGYGVCRAIKVDVGTGIRWHACAARRATALQKTSESGVGKKR